MSFSETCVDVPVAKEDGGGRTTFNVPFVFVAGTEGTGVVEFSLLRLPGVVLDVEARYQSNVSNERME